MDWMGGMEDRYGNDILADGDMEESDGTHLRLNGWTERILSAADLRRIPPRSPTGVYRAGLYCSNPFCSVCACSGWMRITLWQWFIPEHADQPVVEPADFDDGNELFFVLNTFSCELVEELEDLLRLCGHLTS